MKRIAIIAVVLFGCSSKPAAPPPSPTPPVTTEPAPAPAPTPAPTPPNDPPPAPEPTGSATGSGAPTGPGIAAKCGDGDTCAAGLECVKYFGIAGPRGPQFKTCEKRCKVTGDCPTGRSCRTIADGPGQVCR
jgi:hypothetical protein